jgi:hypothetical protein
VSGGHVWVHEPVHSICPFVSVAKRYRVWPFGPVRTVPTDVAMPELTKSDPPLVVVEPEAAGVVVEEEIVDEVDEPAADPEVQAAAVTATAARSATSAHRLRADPGIDLIVERCIFASDLG